MEQTMQAVLSSLPLWKGQLFASPAELPSAALVPVGLGIILAMALRLARSKDRTGRASTAKRPREVRVWRRAA